MTKKVKCSKCGAEILNVTAAENDGQCIPCFRGYRDEIESSRIAAKENQLYLESPEFKYWSSLVKIVCDPELGFLTLKESEKMYFSVKALFNEAFNGGFYNFFRMNSGNQFQYALEGFKVLGATNTLEISRQIQFEYFGHMDYPQSITDRWEILETKDPFTSRIEELENEFRNYH